jgi:FkbM family methyltransferase
MAMMQFVKDTLVKWGPENIVTQAALRVALGRQGFKVGFAADSIALTRGTKTIRVRSEDLSLVPVMAEMHSHFHEMLETRQDCGISTIDFTKPGLHKYRRTGLELMAPTVAEDDSMPQYVLRFQPTEGMTVFDVGAHSGLTTIELSRMVGPSGRVIAFEPDDTARRFLKINLTNNQIENVEIVDAALGEQSGEALFSMDGTQAAGLVDTLVYSRADKVKKVRVMTLREACDEVNAVPIFIKSDIEGGELGMIRGALDFLRNNPTHLAFETHRLRDGSFTHEHLAPLFTLAGYDAEHVVEGPTHQNFMYATPRNPSKGQP